MNSMMKHLKKYTIKHIWLRLLSESILAYREIIENRLCCH